MEKTNRPEGAEKWPSAMHDEKSQKKPTLPESCENSFLLFKQLSSWCFVITTLAN